MNEQPTWRIWPALLLAVAMQTTWLAHWRPGGASIDLPLLLVVSVALQLGWEMGAAYGLCAGLLMGYYAGTNLGSYAMSRLITGGLLGLFERRFSRDNPFTPPLCAMGAVIVANTIFLIISPTDFSVVWWLRYTASSLLAHAILIYPVHWLVTKFILPPPRNIFR
jgi:rod shape-determining protein MreD